MHRSLRLLFSLLVHVSLLGHASAFTTPVSYTSRKVAVPNKLTPPFQHQSLELGLAAPAAAAVASAVSLPSLKTIALANVLPTCIGFWKYEYGVSYAYGTSTAMTAFLVFQALLATGASAFSTTAKLHAAAIIFYGVRLNLFLFQREFFNKRFRHMRERIEERQTKKEGNSGILGKLINRTPFILSCSMLYAGLAAPALSSASLISLQSTPTCNYAILGYKALVGLTWLGFLLAALGDYQKSAVKAKEGPDHLVTTGVYSFFRHPNYTGEVIGWSSSFLAALVAGIGTKSLDVMKNLIPLYALSTVGVVGILFVLCAAAGNLEKRQHEKYGDLFDFMEWRKKTWAGPTLKKKS